MPINCLLFQSLNLHHLCWILLFLLYLYVWIHPASLMKYNKTTQPSWMGHLAIFATREVVYNIQKFCLVSFLKSIKGDFLLKTQLPDLTKSIFGHSKRSLTICSIRLLWARFVASGPFRRGVDKFFVMQDKIFRRLKLHMNIIMICQASIQIRGPKTNSKFPQWLSPTKRI